MLQNLSVRVNSPCSFPILQYGLHPIPFIFPSLFFMVILVVSLFVHSTCPRLSPRPFICAAPTAPLGQTMLWRHSERPLCSYRYETTDSDREWLLEKAPRCMNYRQTKRIESTVASFSLFMPFETEVKKSWLWDHVPPKNCSKSPMVSVHLKGWDWSKLTCRLYNG